MELISIILMRVIINTDVIQLWYRISCYYWSHEKILRDDKNELSSVSAIESNDDFDLQRWGWLIWRSLIHFLSHSYSSYFVSNNFWRKGLVIELFEEVDDLNHLASQISLNWNIEYELEKTFELWRYFAQLIFSTIIKILIVLHCNFLSKDI